MNFSSKEARDKFITDNIPLAIYVLHKTIHSRLRKEDWEDIETVAILSLIKAIDTFNPEKSSFSTYAFIVIQRDIITEYDKMLRNPDYIEDIDLIEECIEDEPDINIEELLTDLKPIDAEIIRRHYMKNEKLVDIAKDMNISYGMCHWYHRRGITQLSLLLQ